MAYNETSDVLDFRAKVAAGGKVNIPPCRLYFKDTLVLNKPVSIVGEYRDFCNLDFTQMAVPTNNAIEIDRVWGYELQNISIIGKRRVNGVGIWNNTRTPNINGSYGTCSGSAILKHLIVYGFDIGLQIGDQNKYIASSENTYEQLQVTGCRVCIQLNDYNTLNHLFNMLLMGDCDYGLVTNGASYIIVNGGSISACNGVAFNLGACSAAFLNFVRMEDSNVFALAGTTGTAIKLYIKGCQLHQMAGLSTKNTTKFANGWQSPIIIGGSGLLTAEDNFISVTAKNFSAILDIHNTPGGLIVANNNTCTIDPSITPFISKNVNAKNCRVKAVNNMWTDAGQVFKGWYPDLI